MNGFTLFGWFILSLFVSHVHARPDELCTSPMVDVMLLVDKSTSMCMHLAHIDRSLQSFLASLSSSNLNYRVGLASYVNDQVILNNGFTSASPNVHANFHAFWDNTATPCNGSSSQHAAIAASFAKSGFSTLGCTDDCDNNWRIGAQKFILHVHSDQESCNNNASVLQTLFEERIYRQIIHRPERLISKALENTIGEHGYMCQSWDLRSMSLQSNADNYFASLLSTVSRSASDNCKSVWSIPGITADNMDTKITKPDPSSMIEVTAYDRCIPFDTTTYIRGTIRRRAFTMSAVPSTGFNVLVAENVYIEQDDSVSSDTTDASVSATTAESTISNVTGVATESVGDTTTVIAEVTTTYASDGENTSEMGAQSTSETSSDANIETTSELIDESSVETKTVSAESDMTTTAAVPSETASVENAESSADSEYVAVQTSNIENTVAITEEAESATTTTDLIDDVNATSIEESEIDIYDDEESEYSLASDYLYEESMETSMAYTDYIMSVAPSAAPTETETTIDAEMTTTDSETTIDAADQIYGAGQQTNAGTSSAEGPSTNTTTTVAIAGIVGGGLITAAGVFLMTKFGSNLTTVSNAAAPMDAVNNTAVTNPLYERTNAYINPIYQTISESDSPV